MATRRLSADWHQCYGYRPVLIETFVERMEEILKGQNLMNCQLCKYREQVIGFEDAVGEHDHPRAGPEHRQPGLDALAQRVEHAEGARQLGHRRGLTTGDHERVDGVDLLGAAHPRGDHAEPLEGGEVLAHVALQGEHADGR